MSIEVESIAEPVMRNLKEDSWCHTTLASRQLMAAHLNPQHRPITDGTAHAGCMNVDGSLSM